MMVNSLGLILYLLYCLNRGQHDQQLKLKEETLGEMDNKIKHLREELQEERDKYQGKVGINQGPVVQS